MSKQIKRGPCLRQAGNELQKHKEERLRRAHLEFFAGVYAFEAVGFVLPSYFAIAEVD